MKRNKFARILSLLLCLALMGGLLAACSEGTSSGSQPSASQSGTGGGDSTSTTEPLEHMDVTLYLWGDKPNQMDAVLEEFHARTKDTLNMTLNIHWEPLDDFTNNIKLRLSAGEEVDMCFDAPWINMNTFILQGNYRDLTGYFNSDAYPNLRTNFNEEYLSNNYMGENQDQVFGIPLSQTFGGGGIVFLRGDLRKAYGLDPVTDYDGFLEYLQAVVENEPNMIPFAMKKDGSYGAESVYNATHPEKDVDKYEKGIWDVEIAPGVTASLWIQDYEIIDCYISGEPFAAKADWPEPWNQEDLDGKLETREWYEKGYIEKDVVTRDDAMAAFTSGLAASFAWDTANYTSVANGLAGLAGTELEVFQPDILLSQNIKGMKKGVYEAWNFLCIPITTSDEKADRIMMFFDWLFASKENHDLFEYGIEGVHWVAVGEDEYTYPDDLDLATNYNFPNYQLCMNPNFIRYPVGYPDVILNTMKAINSSDAYFDPLLSGFRFNGDPVKNELANPDFLEGKTRRDMMGLGIFADVVAESAAVDAAMIGNAVMQEDLAAIKAEVIRQAEIYLANRKEQDAKNGTSYPTVAELMAQLK